MRRGHKKKRKHSVRFARRAKRAIALRQKRRVAAGQCVLGALTVLSHVAAIIGTITVIVDALHRW